MICGLKAFKEKTASSLHFDSINLDFYNKYESNFPLISNDKMNEYLKEVGQKAKLNEKVEIIYTKGGRRTREVLEKWSL